MWDYFDDIRIITIKPESELKNLIKNIKGVGIQNFKINKYPKIGKGENIMDCSLIRKGFNNNEKCCNDMCRSVCRHHYDIIKEAYETGKENVLIFEDDALFFNTTQNKFKKTIDWLKTNDWDLFFFGYMSLLGHPVNLNVLKLYDPWLAHCYAVNRKAMKYILNNMNKNIQIDENYRKFKLNKYGIFPVSSFQPPTTDMNKSKHFWIFLFYLLNGITASSLFIITIIIILIIILIIRTRF